MKGHVTFIGAGPGDPELITLKGYNALCAADVVLYDFLAPVELLGHCKPSATLICVGKRKGYHHVSQQQIQSLMVQYAKEGHDVVRLKGGDPGIFGRLAEEIRELSAQNIAYDIIPGVTAAVAAPESIGIPLTNRDTAQSVAFFTGTCASGNVSDVRIPVADTLVVFMGMTHATALANRILAETPFTSSTPLIIVSHATLPTQSVVTGSLGELAIGDIDTAPIAQPAIMIIGAHYGRYQ